MKKGIYSFMAKCDTFQIHKGEIVKSIGEVQLLPILVVVKFPCVLKIRLQCVFNKNTLSRLGIDVLEGIAWIGTPLCVPTKVFK